MAAAAYALEASEGERLAWGEVEVLMKVTGEMTGGAFAAWIEDAPADTPLHVHEREDELFCVLEGEHVIRVGDREHLVGPGAMVFAPRGVPHAQRRVVPREGRMLILTAPAGFEGFFRELDAAQRDGTLGPAAYATASRNHGIAWLG